MWGQGDLNLLPSNPSIILWYFWHCKALPNARKYLKWWKACHHSPALRSWAFSVFPRFVVLFMDDLGRISQWSSIVAGSLAGMVSMIVTYPTDLIKTRLIVQNMLEPSYRGLSHAFSTIYHQEGFLALYRGVSLTVLGKVELDASWHRWRYYIPSWMLKSILEASSDPEKPGFKATLKNAQLTWVFGVEIYEQAQQDLGALYSLTELHTQRPLLSNPKGFSPSLDEY